ncbi:MAG: hypothetical protein FJ125_02490 [Deltaproteobacteria bacterium]|nr:hypothetical protein [Deltaproteobacteria bacterium]
MQMTREEKERLAERVVAVLRDDDPPARLGELRVQVEAGDEGEHGDNSIVLALATAMWEHLRR